VSYRAAVVLVAVVWLILLAAVVLRSYPADTLALADALTRDTIRVSLAYYAAAAWIMLGLRPVDWQATTPRGGLARACWMLAWAAYVVHLWVAFQIYHHGSHAEAVAHTAERAGVGSGIYVSHLFTLLWTLDVAWWWLRPADYAARPVWIDRALHGFMMFIIFAATVVYEEGPIRWTGLVLCGGLAVRWFMTRRPR
jgi:hypothetical protein